MKAKKLIKSINKFKEKNESCYCYVEGCGFYSSAFVIPCLETKENIVLHNGNTNIDTFKIYETITPKEFKNKVLFFMNDITFENLHMSQKHGNKVFEPISEFNEYYGKTYGSISFKEQRKNKDK